MIEFFFNTALKFLSIAITQYKQKEKKNIGNDAESITNMENRWFGDSRSCLFEVINVLRISLVDTSHVKRWSGGGKVLTKKKNSLREYV